MSGAIPTVDVTKTVTTVRASVTEARERLLAACGGPILAVIFTVGVVVRRCREDLR